VHSSQACFPNATTIIAKQNRLAITVNAFFSVKYFLRKGEANDSNFFIVYKDNLCIHLKKSSSLKIALIIGRSVCGRHDAFTDTVP